MLSPPTGSQGNTRALAAQSSNPTVSPQVKRAMVFALKISPPGVLYTLCCIVGRGLMGLYNDIVKETQRADASPMTASPLSTASATPTLGSQPATLTHPLSTASATPSTPPSPHTRPQMPRSSSSPSTPFPVELGYGEGPHAIAIPNPPQIGTPPGLPLTELTLDPKGNYRGSVLDPATQTSTDIEIRGAVVILDPETKTPKLVGGEVILRTMDSAGKTTTEWTSVEALLSNPGQATAAHSETDCSAAQLPDLPPLPK